LAANKTAVPEKRAAIPPAAIVVLVVLAAGVAGFLYLNHVANRPAPPPPPLTGPARDYVRYLRFVSADGQTPESPKMEAHESYLKQSVVEITGNIQNSGDRVLNLVEINCVFHDPYGQVVLRQRTPIMSGKAGGLAPGAQKPFRLPFDTIPESWDNVMPQLVIARIDFQ